MSKNKEEKIEYIPINDPDEEKQVLRELVIVQEEVKQIKQVMREALGVEISAV